ncbi:hypothetical protein Tco_0217189 [Tanacetum coccineum]
MDRLSKRKFGIVCHEKVVRIPLEGDEVLRVHGKRTQGVVKTLMNTKEGESKLSDISFVRDFIDVFSEDLSMTTTRVSYDLVIFREEHQCRLLRRGAWSSFKVRVGITKEGEVKGRVKLRRVRAMSITIQSSVKDKILATLSETSKYEYEIRYHPGKENVVINALRRKERVKPRCVRAMDMTIQYGVRGMILAAQSETFKQENGMMRTVVMDEAHASRRKPLEFEVGDQVILRVSPWKGIMRFGKKARDPLYYHKILALKLVMMLALIVLEESDYSKELLGLLTGGSNIADLLPRKFVSNLLRRRKDRSLNLDPKVVAEAFMSVKDPLVIVCRGDLSPKIHAACAIFVDLNKSKEEIMRVLFPRKITLSVSTSHNIEPPTQANANFNVNPVNECKGELQMKQKVLKEISEFITTKKGILPCIFSMESAMTTELDQRFCALATALEDEKIKKFSLFCAIGYILLQMKKSLEVKGPQTMEHSNYMKNMDGILDWLNTSRPTVDDFLKRYGSQEPTARQMVASECSNSKTEVEQKGDDGKNKKGKGNKHKKGKQTKGKKK